MKNAFVLFLVSAVLSACTTPEMGVDPDLQTNSTLLPVKGRQGWLINQRLGFGEFNSGKVERGWTKGYDIPFIIHFSGMKEKLQFDLSNGQGETASVFCLGKLREQDLPVLNKAFEVNLKSKDNFAGTIVLDGGHDHYEFLVTNLNQNNHFREAEGFIRGTGLEVAVRPVKTLANGQKYLAEQVPGFEFQLDGKTVGAVETLNNGRVWLKNDLENDRKLVIASMAAALLLRSELERDINS